MLARALSLLLVLLASPLLSGCEIGPFRVGSFRFVSPAPGDLIAGAAHEFVLSAPSYRSDLTIRLDGRPIDAAAWTATSTEARGVLPNLPPGLHELEAEATLTVLFGGIPIRVQTDAVFEVGAAPLFSVRESVEQLHVTRAEPGQELQLLDADGAQVDAGVADYQGSLVFRELEPGLGYRVVGVGSPREVSRSLRVLPIEGSTPPQEFYDGQVLEPGYGYVTMRDGTQLSVFVALPGPPENGPYPVLINYSGYDPSQPVGPLQFGGFDLSFLCEEFPVLCDAPAAPEALLAGVLGYATVGVNMRGTACSGGAFDYFEPLQLLDGYDIVEAVAAQSWAGKVGMIGISYPGISQLFVASMQPPSLAAITPLSVISGVDTTLNPGGIINDGFAVEWGTQVLERADPYGHGWEQGRVDAGDTICEENQLLHSQKVDIIQKAYGNPFYVSEIYDPLNPRTFTDRITVPVFTSGAWQDEQTGGHFPELWDRFPNAPVVKFHGYNGAHADAATPPMLAEMKHFLDFYVAEQILPISETIRTFGPLLFREIFGVATALPLERFSADEDFETQRAAYEAEPPVRILMEMGNSVRNPGAPVPGFTLFFESWPIPETDPQRFFLHADASLQSFAPSEEDAASSFLHDDAKGDETYVVNGSFERAVPNIQWLPETAGRQVGFVTEPFTEDVVMIGPASADLWIQSDADDADLEVLVSEVRPDGNERYISSGWLRASRRALSPESTPLQPVQTQLEADVAPLVEGEWTPVRVEIYPFAHAFHAGTQLRIAIATPGANKGLWKFDVLQLGEGVRVAVAHSAEHPSSVLLPVIPGVPVPTSLPACPSLRSQPCRAYPGESNTPFGSVPE